MAQKSIVIPQLISDKINQAYRPDLLACPGVDRIGVSNESSDAPEITVIYAEQPNIEIHVFPFQKTEFMSMDAEYKDANLVIKGKSLTGIQVLDLIANVARTFIEE